MKNLAKTFAFTILLTSGTLFAAGNQQPVTSSSIKTGLYFSKDGRLNINVENKLNKMTKVQILDSRNQIVFEKKEKYNSRLSKLKVDVNELPDGAYTVQVSNGRDTVSQNVQLETPKQERFRIVEN